MNKDLRLPSKGVLGFLMFPVIGVLVLLGRVTIKKPGFRIDPSGRPIGTYRLEDCEIVLKLGSTIQPAPGFRLRSLSSFLFTKKTFDKVVAPVLADLECEYIEALTESNFKATYVYWRGVASFWMTLVLFVSGSMIGKLVRAFLAG